MRNSILLCVFSASVAGCQLIDFSNQGKVPGSRGVEAWAVSGCPTRPIQINLIYGSASRHGVRWMSPKTAAENFAKKSPWSRVAKVVGGASAGVAVLTGIDAIKAKPQWTTALASAGAFFLVVVPMVQKEVPTVDQAFGQDLLVGVNGCGTTYFYAFPSKVTQFVD